MATPKHTIHPVEKSDLPTLSALVGASKLALTINRLLFKDWPNEVAQKPLYTGAVEGGFANPAFTSLKVVDNETGEIVGYLGLTRKRPVVTATEEKKEEEKASGDLPSSVPFGIVPEVLKEVARVVGKVESGNVFAGKDYYEVTFICVTPTSRRQGIGRQLLQICFDKAKDEKLPLVVCSEPAANDFFGSLGFKETEHADIDLAQFAPKYSGFGMFRLTGMIWEP